MYFKAVWHIIFLSGFVMAICSCGTDRKLLNAYRKSPIFEGIANHIDLNHTYKNTTSGNALCLLPELHYSYCQPWNYPYMRDSAAVALNYDGDRKLHIRFLSADTYADYTLSVKNKGDFDNIFSAK